MIILRVLLIFACIWLLFVLAWRQLRTLLFGSTSANNGKCRNSSKARTSGNARSSIIPDDVGNYVDYTEIKS